MLSLQIIFKNVLYTIITVLSAANLAFSASVTLAWDANIPNPEGYRVFARESGQEYNYGDPIWDGSQTQCTLTGLTVGTTYYFVARAYDGNLESPDTEELNYTPTDDDRDGYSSDEDCNDNDASIYPGATEIFNSIDDNCDGNIDEGFVTYYQDSDIDGFGNPTNIGE